MEMTSKKSCDRCAIKLSEPIVDIVLGGMLLALVLSAPKIFVLIVNGEAAYLFNEQALKAAWFTFAGSYLMSVLKSLVKIADRRYTFSLAWMTLATNVISTGLTAYALLSAGVLDVHFFELLTELTGTLAVVTPIFMNMPLFIMACVCLGMTVDIIVAFAKAAVCSTKKAQA